MIVTMQEEGAAGEASGCVLAGWLQVGRQFNQGSCPEGVGVFIHSPVWPRVSHACQVTTLCG